MNLKTWRRPCLLALLGLVMIEAMLILDSRRTFVGLAAYTRPIHDYFYQDIHGTFRIKSHARGWHRPYDGNQMIPIHVNSIGTRGPEPKAVYDKRVAFLGDSITFDGGVRWEDTFINALDGRFRNDGRNHDFLNFGTSDAGIEQYYLKLIHHAAKHRPDVVVVGLYLNDARPPQGFLGEDGKSKTELIFESSWAYRLELVRRPYRWFRTLWYANRSDLRNRFQWVRRFLEKGYLEDQTEWDAMVAEARFDWGSAWLEDDWMVIEDYLRRMVRYTRDEGMKLVVVMYPAAPQLEVDYPGVDRPQAIAKNVFSRLDIEYIDLLTELRKRDQNEELFADQCHLNRRGNAVVADVVYPWLSSHL